CLPTKYCSPSSFPRQAGIQRSLLSAVAPCSLPGASLDPSRTAAPAGRSGNREGDDNALRRLLVEPDVFHAPAVEMAVHHPGESLDPRLPADPTTGVEQDRPGDVRRQPALDLPENRLAPPRVAFARLLLDQLVYLGVAVAVPVDARPAAVEDLEQRIRV